MLRSKPRRRCKETPNRLHLNGVYDGRKVHAFISGCGDPELAGWASFLPNENLELERPTRGSETTTGMAATGTATATGTAMATGTATGTGTTTGTGTATGTGTTGTTTAPPVEAAPGWLIGVIHFVGGPYNPEFQNAPHAGWVHVRSLSGAVVSVTYVQGEFKIEVPAGVYQVFATERQTMTTPEVDCTGQDVEINPGQLSWVTLGLGCGIP
jgi:hypothetical protein